jgi:hypothetical protein
MFDFLANSPGGGMNGWGHLLDAPFRCAVATIARRGRRPESAGGPVFIPVLF